MVTLDHKAHARIRALAVPILFCFTAAYTERRRAT